MDGVKTCTKCEQTLPLECFYREYRRGGYRPHCRVCYTLDVERARLKRYGRDLAKKREYVATRRQDPEYTKVERLRFKEYRASRPAQFAAYDQQRIARKKGATIGDPSVTADYIAMLREDPCVYCGDKAGTIDHIVPLRRGGAHDWSNMAAACQSCNSSKCDRSLLFWMLGVV